MQTTTSPNTKPVAPNPWDFVRIVQMYGADGLARRYRALLPFVELLHHVGDPALLLKKHWYRSPQLSMSLAGLQAQWEDVRKPDALPWVAAQFWTRDLYMLREVCKGAVTEAPPPDARIMRDFVMPKSLNEYLDGSEFAALVATLNRIGRLELAAAGETL